MTQRNAALVEEATAASQSMAEQAAHLSELMDRYRIGEDASPAVAAPTSQGSALPTAQANLSERRAADRPWSKKGTPSKSGESRPGSGAKAKPAKLAAGSGADEGWQDF